MSKENILLLLDAARKNIFACQVKIEQLEKENAMMREALEFYADMKTYIWDEFAFEILPSSDIEVIKTGHYADMYGGKRAREVLAKLKKGE